MEIESACTAAQDGRDIGTVNDEDNGHLIYTCMDLCSLTFEHRWQKQQPADVT